MEGDGGFGVLWVVVRFARGLGRLELLGFRGFLVRRFGLFFG